MQSPLNQLVEHGGQLFIYLVQTNPESYMTVFVCGSQIHSRATRLSQGEEPDEESLMTPERLNVMLTLLE